MEKEKEKIRRFRQYARARIERTYGQIREKIKRAIVKPNRVYVLYACTCYTYSNTSVTSYFKKMNLIYGKHIICMYIYECIKYNII